MASAERTVAVIGLGNIGAPVAVRLRSAGSRVLAFDLRRRVVAELAGEHDLEAVEDIGAVAGAETIVTILPTGVQVAETFDALASDLRRGALWIDMSSSAPAHTLALGRRAAQHGIRVVDAPLSGGVRRAWDGALTVMVGGDDDAVDAAMPFLQAVGSSVQRTGPLGSGHAMKALNNGVAAAGLVAAGEALTVATRFGIDPKVFVEVINLSTGRNVATERKLPEHVLPRRFDSGFGLSLMVKDITIACELADHERTPAEVLHRVLGVCRQAQRSFDADRDHTEVVSWLLAERADESVVPAALPEADPV